jgi:hypothetical protein
MLATPPLLQHAACMRATPRAKKPLQCSMAAAAYMHGNISDGVSFLSRTLAVVASAYVCIRMHAGLPQRCVHAHDLADREAAHVLLR